MKCLEDELYEGEFKLNDILIVKSLEYIEQERLFFFGCVNELLIRDLNDESFYMRIGEHQTTFNDIDFVNHEKRGGQYFVYASSEDKVYCFLVHSIEEDNGVLKGVCYRGEGSRYSRGCLDKNGFYYRELLRRSRIKKLKRYLE